MKLLVRSTGKTGNRRGTAILLALAIIGLLAVMCQTLTMLAAIQHRQAYQFVDAAQARRLADAGLRRAVVQQELHPDWSGESWAPAIAGGRTASVVLKANKDARGRLELHCEARVTAASGRSHQSHQTLVLNGTAMQTESRTP